MYGHRPNSNVPPSVRKSWWLAQASGNSQRQRSDINELADQRGRKRQCQETVASGQAWPCCPVTDLLLKKQGDSGQGLQFSEHQFPFLQHEMIYN